jgi:hypothetical protein
MSAFVCDRELFIQLSCYAVKDDGNGHPKVDPAYVRVPGLDWATRGVELASAYANLLLWENVRSFATVYPEEGVITSRIAVTWADFRRCASLKAVEVLKMCDCLEYQSCEMEDWEQSPARRLIETIRWAAIRDLPGYEEADWGPCKRIAALRGY